MEVIFELYRAGRTLARTPAFTLASIATLAIGIGATTTVFSLVEAILIDPLPHREADRLVAVGHAAPGLGMQRVGVSEGAYLHYRDGNRVFEEIGTYYESVVNLSADGEAERVPVAMVSHTFFGVLGARTVLGRLPDAGDADGSGEVVVLISHDLWTRRFAADTDIVGSTIEANGVPRRVIGVLEPAFDFPRREIALWYPSDPDPATADATDFFQFAVARLMPGVQVADAERELNRLIASLPEAFPSYTADLLRESRLRAVVMPLKDAVVGDSRAALWLLLGGMVFLLVIAGANVAGLFLVRSEHRQKEIAVRTALGASRTDLRRFFAAESTIIGLASGALAILTAAWGIQILVTYGPDDLPRLHDVGLDWRVAGFAAVLSIVTALCLGAISASHARTHMNTALKESAFAATPGAGRQRTRRALVTGQMALALALLVGSTLLARSFWRLTRVDTGFDAASVLTAEIAMPFTGYETYADAQRLWASLLDRVRALPGVVAAGAVTYVPLVPGPAFHDVPIEVYGRPGDAHPSLAMFHVLPGYFEAMRIPVHQGARVRPDASVASRPVVLSDAAARILFPDGQALGKRIRRADAGADHPWTTVVGIVGDVPRQRIGEDPAPVVYVPVMEEAVDPGLIPRFGTIAVRTEQAPIALVSALRAELRALDPGLPLANVRTMDAVVAASRARASFSTVLIILAAVTALFLGAIGLYGVVSYAVSRRIHEIGIRLALGAHGDDIRRMLAREGAAIALRGIAIGVPVALLLSRFLRSILFDVSPIDPVSFVVAALLLLAVALFASYTPARRAARIDPMTALRAE